jgi:hypothetical protein
LRVDWRRQLVPDFDLIPIRVAAEQVGFPWAELALAQNPATGAFHGPRCGADIRRIYETETEVSYSAWFSSPLARLLKHKHVAAPRCLSLDEALLAVHGHNAEHLSIEAQ